MPVVKRGFLFKFFDKIACAVVALAVLLAVGYAATRASSDADPQVVESALNTISGKLRSQPVPVPFPAEDFESIKIEPDPPQTVRDVFMPKLPVVYPKLTVGRYKEFVLEFQAPIAEGTVRVSGEAPGTGGLLGVLEHPVDDDYSKVKLESFDAEGTALVMADSGDGVPQQYPVEVNKDAGKTAYPPELKLSSSEEGIEVKIIPSAQNTDAGVQVVSYEVWRREWANPLGSFLLVANVKAEEIAPLAAGARGRQPVGMTVGPRTGRGRDAGETTAAGLVWTDTDVKTGESYSYKVRTVGSNTFPQRSDFLELEPVEASPGVDFKWTRSSADKVGCDVVKSFAGQVRKETFWVAEGDEIGGVATQGLSGDLNYKTGLFLVDFHRQVILPGVGVTDRMVYADESGNLHERLRGETKTDLWDRTGSAARQPTGPFGPMGPMGPVGPMGPMGPAGMPSMGDSMRRGR